jgi:hypothetical protein
VKTRLTLPATVSFGKKQQPFNSTPVGTAYRVTAFRTFQLGLADFIAGSLALRPGRFRPFEIQEDRSQLNTTALDALIRALQAQNRQAVSEVSRYGFYPVRVIASRAIHHGAKNIA